MFKSQVIFSVLMLFASVSSFAIVKNPLIRNCQIAGGEYLVASTQNDQIGLCQFGKATIGALETMLFTNNDSILKSVKLYLKGTTDCEPAGVIKPITILGGNTLNFCSYSDNSWIEMGTLNRGQNSTENEKLNEFLGL